jgi:diaminohydroxyphosphoribosylaminopyrimidine deaminase/5-amino-6-(5-phosphoribosylamino)uracil reductase
MAESVDDKFMRRCLDLAIKSEGMTFPNPMVGAVLVYDNNIIGEGYHLKAGGPHAEVIAINLASEKSLLDKSTLYVSLEPCSHFGKTPPCTDLIIESGIPSVVIGTTDTSSDVSGKGISKLIEAGKNVLVGTMEEECRWMNRRFFTFHEKHRPYIILKWAQSADGFIDIERPVTSTAEPYWITGITERILVHKWRSLEQAILVGGTTIRKDRPKLNVRYWSGQDPIKIILSSSGDIEDYLHSDSSGNRILVFTDKNTADFERAEKIILEKETPAAFQIVEYLYNNGIQSLFIEGGTKVFNHFISLGLWDEARIFTGIMNFRKGIKAPVIEGKLYSKSDFAASSLKVLVNESKYESGC